jgi:hypothetical protein
MAGLDYLLSGPEPVANRRPACRSYLGAYDSGAGKSRSVAATALTAAGSSVQGLPVPVAGMELRQIRCLLCRCQLSPRLFEFQKPFGLRWVNSP